MNDDRKMDFQKALFRSDLYQAVQSAEEKLKQTSVSNFDLGTPEERRFALLCWALQQSANGTVGTALTLAGVYRALENVGGEPNPAPSSR